MCTYGSKKELIPNFNILFWRGWQGLLKTLFIFNFGCLVRGGSLIKNSQYRQNHLTLSSYHGFHIQKGTRSIFFLNHPHKSFSQNILLWYIILYQYSTDCSKRTWMPTRISVAPKFFFLIFFLSQKLHLLWKFHE